ncbi:MAG: hypothetical protein V1707_00210 [bacterium]
MERIITIISLVLFFGCNDNQQRKIDSVPSSYATDYNKKVEPQYPDSPHSDRIKTLITSSYTGDERERLDFIFSSGNHYNLFPDTYDYYFLAVRIEASDIEKILLFLVAIDTVIISDAWLWSIKNYDGNSNASDMHVLTGYTHIMHTIRDREKYITKIVKYCVNMDMNKDQVISEKEADDYFLEMLTIKNTCEEKIGKSGKLIVYPHYFPW